MKDLAAGAEGAGLVANRRDIDRYAANPRQGRWGGGEVQFMGQRLAPGQRVDQPDPTGSDRRAAAERRGGHHALHNSADGHGHANKAPVGASKDWV